MLQIIGQVQSVNAKRSGSSNGKNWTIYEVMINGQKFDTFDNEYLTKIGQSGTFEYETISKVSNGRTYQNNRLASLTKKAAAGSGAGMAKLDLILSKQDEILGLLHSMGQNVPVGEDQGVGIEDINVEDIPF